MGVTIQLAQLIEQVSGVEKIPISDNSGLPKAVTTELLKTYIDVPSKTSELTNDSGFLTEHLDISHLATQNLIPTKVSLLENDSNYVLEDILTSEFSIKAISATGELLDLDLADTSCVAVAYRGESCSFIIAKHDVLNSSKFYWGKNLKGYDIPNLANFSSMSSLLNDFNGSLNTKAIISSYDYFGVEMNDSDMCKGFETYKETYTDWYIPTASQLLLLFYCINEINEMLNKIGGTPLSTTDYYWSSTEHSANQAWVAKLTNGKVLFNFDKDTLRLLRLVRDAKTIKLRISNLETRVTELENIPEPDLTEYATKEELKTYIDTELSELDSKVESCVKKEDGKILINKTFNDKLEGIDLDVEKINIIYNKTISEISMPGFSVENVDEGIRIRKKSGDGKDTPDWCYINFKLDEGYVWEKDHKYYLAVDMLITEDSQISNGCSIAAKYSITTTIGETYTAKHGVLGERHLYKLKLPINKDSAAEYTNACKLFFQFGKYGKDDVFDGIIYNIYIADVGIEGADVNELWDNFDRVVIEKGLLSFKTTTNKELGKLVAGLNIQKEPAHKNIISNLAINNNQAYGPGVKYSIGQNNVLLQASKDIGVGKENGDYYFVNFLLDDGIYWKKNHHYYCVIDAKTVYSDSPSSYLSATPKFDNSHGVGSGIYKSAPNNGERGLHKFLIDVNREENIDLYQDSRRLYIQFWNLIYPNQTFEVNIYNITIIDLGNPNSNDYIEWEEVDKMFQEGTLDECSVSIARYAKNIKKNNIECWGDSLTAQKYGKYIEGTTVYTHGFGGKTSTYIRDEFFKNHNPNRTQVIWVGRNNNTETDVVIDDIRDMVSALTHNNFIIMCPPNGYYGEFGTNGEDGTGEMRGGNGHSKFLELEKRLSEEYPSNFLNIRKAVIEGWRMGNVRLLSDFTQPSVGNNVTIEVSDATFLTTYNSNDLNKFGLDFMSKIRIGINGKYDVYKVVEKVDDTHLTVQLEESNRIAVGSTVGNLIDNGGNSAVKYLRVMQNADYMCWLYDTTLSTFRKDGIHMTEDGLKLVALIVSRKLASMKLL